MDLSTIAACAAAFISAATFFSSRRDKRFDQINKRFDHIDKKFDHLEIRFDKIDKRFEYLDKQINDIWGEMSEIKERISFMEAFMFFSETQESPSRSEAAKKAWRKRRGINIEHKD